MAVAGHSYYPRGVRVWETGNGDRGERWYSCFFTILPLSLLHRGRQKGCLWGSVQGLVQWLWHRHSAYLSILSSENIHQASLPVSNDHPKRQTLNKNCWKEHTHNHTPLLTQSCLWVLSSLWPHRLYVARQAALSMGFFRQDTGVDCHFLLQGISPDPGIKPESPALADRFLTTASPGKFL